MTQFAQKHKHDRTPDAAGANVFGCLLQNIFLGAELACLWSWFLARSLAKFAKTIAGRLADRVGVQIRLIEVASQVCLGVNR